MNKNTLKKLADNPHYSMNADEIEALAQLLQEEAAAAKKDEVKLRKVQKNRVKKTTVDLDVIKGLEEDENGDS